MRAKTQSRGEDLALLSIKDLRVYFDTPEGTARAVDGLGYDVYPGETLGVVGESGCGKSVTALSILRLIPTPPGQIVSGEILFQGQDLLELPISRMRQVRGNRISMIFQEPMSSLNPVFSIGYQLSRVFRLHRHLSKREARQHAIRAMAACDIPSPERLLDAYPHQLSGGMRQRVMIAMALGCKPDLLIADEPTTALDVTIQAQILDLITRLQQETGTAMILITHDLGIIARAARRVVVMYAGQKVEEAPVELLFDRPLHPYTAALLESLPMPNRHTRFLPEIPGVVPPPYLRQPGCSFAERCAEVRRNCRLHQPALRRVEENHWVACSRRY